MDSFTWIHTMKRFATTIVMVSALVAASHALNLGTANSFNAFIFGDASVLGESEGAIAVGGNLTSSTYNIAIKKVLGTVGSLNNIGAYVGGNVNFTGNIQINGGSAYVDGSFSTNSHFNINSGGSLYYGTTTSGTVQGGSSVQADLVDDNVFAAQKAYSLAQSSYLAGLSGTAISGSGDLTLNVGSGMNVFTINASQLADQRLLTLNGLTSSSTVVINVKGDVPTFGLELKSGWEQVVWNFSNATTINVDGRRLNGSLLAPNATVYQSQLICGTVIAQNWVGAKSAEVHTHIFKGELGEPSVPGPAAAISFGSALIAGFIRRRKKA